MTARYPKAIATAVIAVAAFLAGAWFVGSDNKTELYIDVDDKIDITPEQIEHIKAIGEWEFLSIANEELVDTVRKGLISNDHLVRIYYGTLRLGVNMRHVEPGWLKAAGDSIEVTLPPIELLDRDFIDEARTRSFHESGSWSGADREALYRRAHRLMTAHCMTPQNIEAARRNGESQFRKMMQAMGYRHIAVSFKSK